MNIFKAIWIKIKGLFDNRPIPTKQTIKEEKTKIPNEIKAEDNHAKTQNKSNEEEKEILNKKAPSQEVAKEINNPVDNEATPTVRNNSAYELNELRDELQRLEEKKTALYIAASEIHMVQYPDTSSIDIKVTHLSSILNSNHLVNKSNFMNYSAIEFDKEYSQLEKLLSENSTLTKYSKREKERKIQREIHKKNINQELNTLDTLIDQNKLKDAKSRLNKIKKSIKPDFTKEVKRLSKATKKLKEKELEVLKQKELELLEQKQKEAERIRIEQEILLKKQRLAREQAEAKRKIEESNKLEKENKLKALLTKKFNWRDFQKVLQENGITKFYHFTDYLNLKSIKDNNGLYSWYYADKNGIEINHPGGGSLSRQLDLRHGLHDHVSVSFCSDHPMQYRLEKLGRELVLLEVDIEVAYYVNTIFSNMNATDNNHKKGTELKDLQRIRFSATKRTFVRNDDVDFKHHQAEVLVKTWIPLKHIKNINKFI